MPKQKNYQDQFLKKLSSTEESVTIYLVNGVRMKGIITEFDNFVLVLNTDKGQQMVYKHAISTIAPSNSKEILK